MISRERVLTALKRQEPDRPPMCSRFTPPVMRLFNEKVNANIPAEQLKNNSIPTGFIVDPMPSGVITPDDYFEWDIRHVAFKPTKHLNDFHRYLPNLPENAEVSEWGIGLIPQKNAHYVSRMFPLKGIVPDPKEIDDYPFPDVMADYRHCHLEAQVSDWQRKGYAVAGFLQETIFELAWGLRGFENIFLDFIENPEFIEKLLDKITELRCQMAARYAEAGVDIIRLGDDLGTQRALLMSPELWRSWLKPRLAAVIRSARQIKPDIHIFYHTDGYVEPLIEELIEIGIDILNPVQPECMDPLMIKEKYGDRMSFWGTIGTQTTMPFGTPEEVKRIVQERIATVGKGGGLVLGPTHALQPDVPWENIVTLFETIKNWRS
jgi:uroporphyrinogen decarboxylase